MGFIYLIGNTAIAKVQWVIVKGCVLIALLLNVMSLNFSPRSMTLRQTKPKWPNWTIDSHTYISVYVTSDYECAYRYSFPQMIGSFIFKCIGDEAVGQLLHIMFSMYDVNTWANIPQHQIGHLRGTASVNVLSAWCKPSRIWTLGPWDINETHSETRLLQRHWICKWLTFEWFGSDLQATQSCVCVFTCSIAPN